MPNTRNSNIDVKHLQEELTLVQQENARLKLLNQHLLAGFQANKQKDDLNEFLLREYALNNSQESIITISKDGQILYYNETTWKRLGYEQVQAFPYRSIIELDPYFSDELWAIYWEKLKLLKTFSHHAHHKTASEQLLPVEMTATFLEYDQQEYCIAFVKDMSNLKAAEEIIGQTELLLDSILKNSSDALAVSMVEDDGQYRLLYINHSYLKAVSNISMTTYQERDLIGKTHQELFLDVFNAPQELLDYDNQKRQEAIVQKNTIVYDEVYWVDDQTRYFESSVTPIFQNNGKCTHLLWSTRDVTERKQTEDERGKLLNETLTLNEELKASEEELRQMLDSTIELNSQLEEKEQKLRAIFDSSESISYLINTDNHIIWFNKPAYDAIKMQLGIELCVGLDFMKIVSDIFREPYLDAFHKGLKGETVVVEREVEGYNPLGKYNEKTWLQSTSRPVYKNEGELLGIALTLTNITNRKQNEEELKQKNRELIYQNEQLNQYSYIVSHNLRGPIATLLGLTNIYETSGTTESVRNDLIKYIQKSTQHLDNIIRDLNLILSLTKETDHSKTPVDFANELSIIQDLYKLQIEKSEATFDTDFTQASGITAIRSFLHSIFSNLISNSLKYKKANEPLLIHIRSKKKSQHIVITYSDNGIGIDLERNKDKIFGFYKRFHTHVEGKGMGLHLIKTQVEMMGGRIEVESTVNQGTTFTIILKSF